RRRRRTLPAVLQVLDGYRLDAVGRLDAEHAREEVLLALDRALDVLVLAKPVLLALVRDVGVRQLLLPARLDERLGLVGWNDFVFEALEQDDRALQLVCESNRRAVAVHVDALWIWADKRLAVVRLELVRLHDEKLEVAY